MHTKQRASALQTAQHTIETATAEGRDLTSAETEAVESTIAEVKAFDHTQRTSTARKLPGLLNDPAFMVGPDEAIDADGNRTIVPARGSSSSGQRLTLAGVRSAAASAASKMAVTDSVGRKALLPSGTAVVSIPLSPNPVTIAQPATGLLDLLPVVQTGAVFAFLSQTTRTNNAAPVAPGGLKPTSTYGLVRIQDRLRVIAHLSEAIDRFWLEDAASLRTFVQNELLFGLYRAVEGEVLAGDGTGEHLTGLLNTSGVPVQAFTTSAILTARAALTKIGLSA